MHRARCRWIGMDLPPLSLDVRHQRALPTYAPVIAMYLDIHLAGQPDICRVRAHLHLES